MRRKLSSQVIDVAKTMASLQYKDQLTKYVIPIVEIRRRRMRFIFSTGVPILVSQQLHFETVPKLLIAMNIHR